ncbi:MAG: ABC transporter ATP-binding protein [Acidobacteriota bacterium]
MVDKQGMNERAIEIKNLYKSFKFHLSLRTFRIIKDLSLEADRGEIYGFIGPNGAGKTTTIKLIMGLIFPDRGNIRILGQSPYDRKTRARIGFLPENPCFYEYLTGREFLDFYGRLLGIPSAERKGRSEELIALVGLSGKEDLQLRKYSRGMIQRLGFAQVLLNDPELLILDEPMSSLDPIGRRELRDIIIDLRRKGKTIFFSSHILQDAEMICDRVGIIKDGEIRLQGKLSELLSAKIKFWDVACSNFDPESAPIKKHILSSKDGERLVRIYSEMELNLFIEELGKSGGHVISILPQRETLEDLFMRKVGEKA